MGSDPSNPFDLKFEVEVVGVEALKKGLSECEDAYARLSKEVNNAAKTLLDYSKVSVESFEKITKSTIISDITESFKSLSESLVDSTAVIDKTYKLFINFESMSKSLVIDIGELSKLFGDILSSKVLDSLNSGFDSLWRTFKNLSTSTSKASISVNLLGNSLHAANTKITPILATMLQNFTDINTQMSLMTKPLVGIVPQLNNINVATNRLQKTLIALGRTRVRMPEEQRGIGGGGGGHGGGPPNLMNILFGHGAGLGIPGVAGRLLGAGLKFVAGGVGVAVTAASYAVYKLISEYIEFNNVVLKLNSTLSAQPAIISKATSFLAKHSTYLDYTRKEMAEVIQQLGGLHLVSGKTQEDAAIFEGMTLDTLQLSKSMDISTSSVVNFYDKFSRVYRLPVTGLRGISSAMKSIQESTSMSGAELLNFAGTLEDTMGRMQLSTGAIKVSAVRDIMSITGFAKNSGVDLTKSLHKTFSEAMTLGSKQGLDWLVFIASMTGQGIEKVRNMLEAGDFVTPFILSMNALKRFVKENHKALFYYEKYLTEVFNMDRATLTKLVNLDTEGLKKFIETQRKAEQEGDRHKKVAESQQSLLTKRWVEFKNAFHEFSLAIGEDLHELGTLISEGIVGPLTEATKALTYLHKLIQPSTFKTKEFEEAKARNTTSLLKDVSRRSMPDIRGFVKGEMVGEAARKGETLITPKGKVNVDELKRRARLVYPGYIDEDLEGIVGGWKSQLEQIIKTSGVKEGDFRKILLNGKSAGLQGQPNSLINNAKGGSLKSNLDKFIDIGTKPKENLNNLQTVPATPSVPAAPNGHILDIRDMLNPLFNTLPDLFNSKLTSTSSLPPDLFNSKLTSTSSLPPDLFNSKLTSTSSLPKPQVVVTQNSKETNTILEKILLVLQESSNNSSSAVKLPVGMSYINNSLGLGNRV